MKKAIYILCIIILVCSYSFSQNGWYNQNSGTNKFLTDVCFVDQNIGWASGWTGTILHTEDGGENWSMQNPPPNNAYEGVYFIDDLTGWAVGYGGKIIFTSDGGVTWEEQVSGTSYYILDVQFIDANIGWTAGGRFADFNIDPIREILYTNNGGDTWETQLLESDEPPLNSIHFQDSDIGFAVGEGGKILKTTNGGQFWDELMSDQQYHFYDVEFVNNNTGWVVGQDLSIDHLAVIFNTTDGGLTWTLQTFNSDESLQGVCFADNMNGWVVGGGGTSAVILHTSDGGVVWDYQDPDNAKSLKSVSFINDEIGWAVGYDGTITHTDDGGIVDIEGLIDDNTFATKVSPNPFSNITTINFNLEQPSQVIISIFNQLGQKVKMIKQQYEVGKQQFIWNADGLPSGFYHYYIKTDEQIASGEMFKAM